MNTRQRGSQHSDDPLLANLLDLLYELRDTGIRLTLAGGYGLYLKHSHVLNGGYRVLVEEVPPARSTSDLDIFLQTELFAHPRDLKLLREALDRLGYTPHSPNWQFVRAGSSSNFRIDLHSKTPDPAKYPNLRYDAVRVKPPEKVGLHGRNTPEAVTIEESPLQIVVSGCLTNGTPFEAPLCLPHAHPFLMMKLHAFRDEELQANLSFARKHATDIYTITAIMTEAEYETCRELSSVYAEHSAVTETAEIVKDCFSNDSALGIIRIREQGFSPSKSSVEAFVSALAGAFSR